MDRSISIRGARTHNLRNLDLDLPLKRLTVVTGVSGSGKSSLVFDTLYAEGQRRYVQSLSTYARLFLERMDKPDVDSISDIPPALALRQKNSIRNARSTVGSVTEVNDYVRLLFAKIGRTFCPKCGQEVKRDTVESAATRILERPGAYLIVAAFELEKRPPSQALEYLIQNGYHRLFQGGATVDTAEVAAQLGRGNLQISMPVEVQIDRVIVHGPGEAERVREALEKAFYLGRGRARAYEIARQDGRMQVIDCISFDRSFVCSRCALTFPEPSPALFSANSALGACPACEGFGRTVELDFERIIPNPKLSLRQGLVAPWRTPAYREMHQWMLECARRKRIRLTAPYNEFTAAERVWLLDGEAAPEASETDGHRWPGVRGFFRWLENRRYKTHVRILLAKYRRFAPCTMCAGTKLRAEANNVTVGGMRFAEVGCRAIIDIPAWLKLAAREPFAERAQAVLRELENRLAYLNEVGLGYLTLERQARTLSGGEAQRIHLASALGSLLTGTLYALDEPTVGLHARDSRRLLGVLRHLRDLGNTVVVVEHDPTMIAGADHVVELGPGGGSQGGTLLSVGAANGAGQNDPPGRVLLMRALARKSSDGDHARTIEIRGARAHNLKNIDVSIPLGKLVCITGVSGSGKSTLVENVLYNNYLAARGEPAAERGDCDRIEGLERLESIVHMGQETLARSARSNPATYLKLYDTIRKLFAATNEARRLGIDARHFSFNVARGRCERCKGTGTLTIEMHFMADVEVKCESCEGRRFQSHVLGVRLHGLNIAQVLELTVEEARALFANRPDLVARLTALSSVGLGYLQLGQSTSTLSGGEAQRLKLAAFMLAGHELGSAGKPATRARGRMFILDEPTTGLSASDVKNLLRVFFRLVEEGDTVLVIEHNLQVIAQADYLIDLGPEGGEEGGSLVVAGTPVEVAACDESPTGRELAHLFGLKGRASRRPARGAGKRSRRSP